MSADSERKETQPASADCPLSHADQTRNLLLYAANVTLIYVGAPVLYVGLLQASLCEKLGATKTVANLPSTLYFWMTILPIVVAWYFCAVRHLKPVLVAAYLISAVTGAMVVGCLLQTTPEGIGKALLGANGWLPKDFQLPADWVVPAVLMHSAVLGGALVTVSTYQWEMIGRGVSQSRRGQALALAFGIGPILAFGSSLASQQILTQIAYPHNYAALFAITVPLMIVGAYFSTLFVVPAPTVEIARVALAGGSLRERLGRLFTETVGDFFSYRPLLFAAIAMMLVGSGYNIITNISLFTKEALGEQAEQYVGIQNAIRFGVKSAGGLLLGWLLTRTHPRAGLMVTGAFCLASVLWVLGSSGKWFLLSFGLMGVGELFGVYYPNYILSCSAKARMRRNMAFTSMLNMPLGVIAIVYGLLADNYGLRASFHLAIALLGATLLLVQFGLPARPKPSEPEPDVPETVAEKDALPAGT